MQANHDSQRGLVKIHASLTYRKPPRLRKPWPAACAAWLVLSAWTAQAQAPARTRAHLGLAAPAGCASAAELTQRVARRSSRIELVDAAQPAAAELQITLQPGPAGVSAQLALTTADGRRSERQVVGADCQQASDAIALLIVLALDPGARTEPPAATSDKSAAHEPVARPQRASSATQAGEAGATSAAQPPRSEQTAVIPDQQPRPGAETLPQPTAAERSTPADQGSSAARDAAHSGAPGLVQELSLGAGGVLVSGVAPGWLPGLSAQLRLVLAGAAPWTLALQLGFIHTLRGSWRAAGGVAEFQLDEAHLDLCPVSAGLGPVVARGCLAGTLGSLSAAGTETYSPAARSRLWSTVGAALLGTFAFQERLSLELRAGLAVPLSRDRFAFAPTVFHRVDAVTIDLRVALALHFL